MKPARGSKRDCWFAIGRLPGFEIGNTPDARRRASGVLPFLLFWLQLGLGGSLLPAAETTVTGEQIYRTRCAKCHGAEGEGTAVDYPEPLAGERSVAELAEFITKSMPPNAPQKCSAEDAQRVAGYVFERFYSAEARARRITPPMTLNHLTTRQYRNAIADLMLSFRGGTGKLDEQRGLQASYNAIEPNGDGRHVMSRLDPEVRFDFGQSSPDPEKIPPREFAISWQGSLLAPVTGEYVFMIRSENSVSLWVNDRVQPLIDGWVKSGDVHEYRSPVHLLGGRRYPVLLNFTKRGQGVAKPAEQAAKEEIKPAAISLSWVLPGREAEIIPREYLAPHHYPESYVVETRFPPDDRSTGFERGSSISREWDQATTDAALEIADYVRLRLNDLTGGAQPGPEYERQLREFCRQFAERAFRGPLTPAQQERYIDRQFDGTADLETTVQKVVLMVLKSPRFLYHGVGAQNKNGYREATRLAFALWDAPPDAPLTAAAAGGKLVTREQLLEQAERMSRDPRFRFKLREFLLQWMKLDQVLELNKSVVEFPGFDAATAHDLRQSLELSLDDLLASEACDFRQLFLDDKIYLNGRLSKVYGGDLPEGAAFQRVVIDGDLRAGILTHPYLMAVFADATTTSPIRRGVFVARSVLGRALLPPPDAFVPLAPSLHPDLTTRERVGLQTRDASCQTCHALINPLGFTLENFDAIGRFRTQEGPKEVDASGEYLPRLGVKVDFHGARELAVYLAQSEEAQAAFVEKLFHFAVQQPIRAYGSETSAQLRKSFAASGFQLRKLLIEIAITAAVDNRSQTLQSRADQAE